MTENELFDLVGIRTEEAKPATTTCKKDVPYISLIVLAVIVVGCLLAEVIITKDPTYMDLANFSNPPSGEFLFGTDTLGRDVFSCIWYGGRISLFVGFFATVISTVIAVVYGTVSGLAPRRLDNLMMCIIDIFLSVPTLLVIIFVQAILGEASVASISVVIGITSWCTIAKVVRTEVLQLRASEYVIASKCMGGGFVHVLLTHLLPNFVSSVMFMVVMNVRGAIASESTLSFLGMGLPLEIISWGSMLSLAEDAMMTGCWWIILIPGLFLVTLLVSLTNIGNWLRKNVNQKERNL